MTSKHHPMQSSSSEIKQVNKLLVVFRKVTFLTIAALMSTVVITFGYINYKPFAFALSLDAVFNSFCVFSMFQFNQKFIAPCVGRKCDRLCCIKFKGLCKCRIICCGCKACKHKNAKDNEENSFPPSTAMTIDIKSVSSISAGSPKMNMTESSRDTELNMVNNKKEHFHGCDLMEMEMEMETDEIMEASESEKP